MAKNLLRPRLFPSQYPEDAVKVLETMAFNPNNLILIGSSSLRSQTFSGDFDANELVEVHYKTDKEALNYLVHRFQSIIRKLQKMRDTYIGDIKSGIIEDWRVIPKTGSYNFRSATEKIERLLQDKIISPKEAKEAKDLLKEHPTPTDNAIARQGIKFHLVRWSPQEILNGSQKLRDGRNYTLQEAFSSPTITKLDVISLVLQSGSRYTEFAVIYEFHNNGKTLNPDKFDPESTLKESILFYKAQKNSFKVAKRRFALAKLHNNLTQVKKWSQILNSELGKVYVIYSDIKTLADLIENHPIKKDNLLSALSRFRQRLGYIYAYEPYLKKESAIFQDLKKVAQAKNPLPILKHLEDQLFSILNASPKLLGAGILAGKSYVPYPI